MARLVLVGLPGSGKSSVAAELARDWECAAVDTDELVSEDVGTPVGEYLRRAGEPAFRAAELVALTRALDLDAVVATGGGVVCTPEARRLLAGALTVWLDCADSVLAARVRMGDRPLLAGDPVAALSRLRAERTAWYEEVSRARVDASGSTTQVALAVREALGRLIV